LARTKADLAWGKALRACRINAGLTQAQAAMRLGLTQQEVSKLETGRLIVKGRDIPKAAKAYRMSIRAVCDVFIALYEA
jgi:transcriptional regulator with XRE-family HTH domain